MNDSRPIQRYAGNAREGSQPAASIMTPQGPAIIQIIDMPSGLGPVNNQSPNARRKPGGINVVGAVLRRWWLVLIVFLIVGGGAYFAGANLVKPQYTATAKVSFIDNNPGPSGVGIAYTTIHRKLLLINSRDIVLKVAEDPVLRALLPKIFNVDLKDPAQQLAVVQSALGMVEIPAETINGTGVLDIVSVANTPEQAAAIANAYANALVWSCEKDINDVNRKQIVVLEDLLKKGQDEVGALLAQKARLIAESNFDALDAARVATLQQLTNLEGDRIKAESAAVIAQQQIDRLTKAKQESPGLQLQRADIIQSKKAQDTVLKGLLEQMGAWYGKLSEARSLGKTEEHPDVRGANQAIARCAKDIADREAAIAKIVNDDLDKQFKLKSEDTLEQAMIAKETAENQIKRVTEEKVKLNAEAKKVAYIKEQITLLDSQAIEKTHQNQDNSKALLDARNALFSLPSAVFRVEQPGVAILKEDKRIKVQAGGLVGGLFLGILLALLVDRFDKRLRDPRDIEPLFGTPLLGCIPRIQELKRIKGDQARNLIAEEFRIIRTQVLFGNPNLSHKLIAVTSPTPGDGKTSLAVNLAISIAKAGRRVLLIDGDLRKPDVHRVFNLSDSPGFAELIQGSHEPGAVIKKSEVDGLEILPAGTPLTRPSELLSRPEMARLLMALGDLYDHIVLDTAPLLPVSDTHVLAGMVDAVIVSFNAEVDRDTVTLTQEILRRSRANVIGSVMNQVKYRQSGSYHRGKTAYDSYYNSPRGAPKTDKLATVGK